MNTKKRVAIIGSTGSIGTQALKVIAASGHSVAALAAGNNARLLYEQAAAFSPGVVAVADIEAALWLKEKLRGSGIEVLSGSDGVCAAASEQSADVVLNAAVGIAGLRPTMAAINAGKTLALANKESLVCAGDIVMAAAQRNGVDIIPVDSEHSAIFQCMRAGRRHEVERVILTASGGAFFGMTRGELENVTPQQALAHPTWSMGSKITIDSASMMNKGFEMIEAKHLFGLEPDMIDVVIHRESIVHSLVEFRDGATVAQLSPPDMCLAIQYALDWPERLYSDRRRLDLAGIGKLTFFKPDEDVFPALRLCRGALAAPSGYGAAINGANEQAVAMFLRGEIGFNRIFELVNDAASAISRGGATLDEIFEIDRDAREYVIRASR